MNFLSHGVHAKTFFYKKYKTHMEIHINIKLCDDFEAKHSYIFLQALKTNKNSKQIFLLSRPFSELI